MAVDAGDERCRAAAYHEAGHIVIACCLGLPISPKGIIINNFADGRASFFGASGGVAIASAAVDNVVVALLAGGIAHRRMIGDIQGACNGDDWRVNELLEGEYPDENAREAKRKQLISRASTIVNEHWPVITRVAEALWSRPWKPKNPYRHWPKEKTLQGSELESMTDGIAVVIDDAVE